MVQNDCIWHGKLVAPKVWCRELQSGFCDGLGITSRKSNRFLYRVDCKVKQLYCSNAGCKVAITLCTIHGFKIYRNKSEPTFTRWSKGIGKVVICKALHKGDVNLKSADSRAVTKQGLFDCEPAHTADRMVQCDKTTFAQWAKEAKCNIQYCFHLWQSVNENKCVTAVRIQP